MEERSGGRLMTTAALVATSATVLAAGLWAGLRQHNKKKTPAAVFQENSQYIRLNDFEDLSLQRGSAPISTITWFSGNHETAARIVRERLQLILNANPWLLGRFATVKGQNYIAYETAAAAENDLSSVFTHRSDSTVSRDTSLGDLATACSTANHLLKAYKDREQPFWQVSLFPCTKSPDDTFGITFSMSHVVGDGHTFYALYNMVVSGEPIRALETTRILETTQLQIQAMGETEQGFMGSAGFMLCALRGLFLQHVVSRFVDGQHGRSRYFLVDAAKIAELKKQAAVSVPFCSSNDVISSWFMQNNGCNCSIMAINFRNRLPGHSDEHAGNYENLLYYRCSDSATPELIRKSLSILKRAVTHQTPISTLEVGTGCIAFCTNWASFVSDKVDLAGCTQQLHLPVYNWNESLPSTMAVGLIFQANPNQLAVCLGATPDKLQDLVAAPFEDTSRELK